jgi:hypothetical protein
MDALKAGIEKIKEAIEGKKTDDKLEKAFDSNVKPSERTDAQFEENQTEAKAVEHHVNAEEYKAKHMDN